MKALRALGALFCALFATAALAQTQPVPSALGPGGTFINTQPTAPVVAPAGGGAGLGCVVSSSCPLPVQTGQTATDGSVAFATAGTPQVLFGGVTPTNGFKLAWPSASTGGICWYSYTTATPSATTAGSWPLYEQASASTEPGERPSGPAYINCPRSSMPLSAIKW